MGELAMRKTVLITLSALLALVSCTKEQAMPEDVIKGTVTFKASIVETKTHLGDKEGTSWPNYWSEGDYICVNGVNSTPLDASFDGSATAQFTVEGVAAPFYAVYPGYLVSDYANGAATINIPDEQGYVDGSYDPDAYVMVGKTSGESLAFVPQMAIFSITPTGTGPGIKSVSLTSLGGKKIAGAFTTDFESITAADGAKSTVTVSASEEIDLGEPWRILIPASDFTEEGIKIVITDINNGVMTRTTKPSKAYAAGKMYSATIPYSPDPLSLEAVTASSSSLVFGWGRGSAAADGLSAYTVALYTEEACSNLVVSYALPAEAGVWQDADANEREPRFVIGGLAPSTTYYCKVTDNTKNEVSDVVPATTLAFTPVDAKAVSNASAGDVLLAEDFSEIGWGPDEFFEAAGFVPSPKNLEAISGPHSNAEGDGIYVACKNTGNRLFGAGNVDLGDKRLSTDWGYFGNSSVYIRNGYLRVSTTGGRTHIVTPALAGIPAGKFATIDVSVTATKHESNSNDIAVFVENGLTLSGETQPTVESFRKYTGASLSDGHALGFTASREWETKTVRIANVTSEDQLLIGSLNNVSGLNRFSLSDIKVELVSLSDDALMEASCIAASSSTLVFEWSNGGTAAEDGLFPYIIELYSDAECTESVVSHVIEPGEDPETGEPKAHGCWNGKTPRFVFGSLDPGTTYYFRVINAGNGKTTAVIPGTTSAFTVVDATTVSNASVGDVILAEDFSEIGFGADQLKSAAGFIPTSKTLEPVIGEFSSEEGVYVVYNSTARRLYGDANVQPAYRLYDWGFFGNSAVYAFAGYLRVCTSESGARTHIVSPALAGIPDGKLATIDVTVTSCKYESSTNDIAVFVEKAGDLTLVLAPDQVESTSPKFSSQGGKYTGATLSDGYPLGAVNGDWTTNTVRIKNVTNANRLLFGSYQNVDKKNRFFLSDVKVEIVDLKEAGQIEEEMNINDFSTLKTFLTKCADGLTMAGNVTASIALSDEEEADIASLYPVDYFEGVLNGGGYTISGLKKPLINRLAGAVSNLTLESEINITEAQNNVGIFAMEATSPAVLTGCVSRGSVTLNVADGVNGDLFIGGMVGKIISGVTLTDCVNYAPVTNATNSGDTSSGIISVGGITGYAGSTIFSKCINNGDVTNSGVAGSGDTYCRVGGLVGWAVSSNLSASGENKNINYGDVTEESDSKDSAFAGVVAFADGEVSDLSNCRNEGDITFGGSKTYAFLGGVAGAFANSSVIDNTYNTGSITASGATMAKSGYMRCGGIVGGWFKAACTPQTITGCTNTGSITFQPAGLGGEAGGGVDSFVGGIAGGGNNSGVCGKALINCTNSGAITMGSTGSVNSGKLYHRYCVGGIIGFTDVNPTGSKCIANIRFRTTSGTNRIGGIAGEMMVDEIHDVTYKGTVNSNGTSGTNYTGGLVGNVGTGEKTFRNCTLSGTMRGPNSEGPGAGIFFSCKGGGTGPTVNIASCKVGSGTRLQSAASGYVVTITTADQITAANVCGTNGSTRTCTAGTNDGLSTVVDPDTITL